MAFQSSRLSALLPLDAEALEVGTPLAGGGGEKIGKMIESGHGLIDSRP